MTMNDPPAGGNDNSQLPCPMPSALKIKDKRKKIKELSMNDYE